MNINEVQDSVMSLNLFFVIGTRPEIIKMAPILHECDRRKIDYFLLHTGQHYSTTMSQFFFKEMDLRAPDANLNIGSGSHAEQTAKALVGIEKNLLREKPDVVLVQGDTNAVLSATLASVKMNIPVGHIEAGLRSYNMQMPEEHNRRLTDHASSFLFAPTETSARILRNEMVWGKIFVTGNTVIDSIERSAKKGRKVETAAERLKLDRYVLLTLHRPENVDDKTTLTGLLKGLLALDLDIIFPAHPRTQSKLDEFGLLPIIEANAKFHMMDPVGYLEFIALLRGCDFVLTDSGGIQEEITAPSIQKRAFVLRTSTERPESVEAGYVKVVGINQGEFPEIIRNNLATVPPSLGSYPYGRGNAAQKIVDIISNNIV